MNPLESPVEPLEFLNHGELTAVQLQIARRADELTAEVPRGPAADRRRWLRAEFEIFERVELARPRALTCVSRER